MYRGEMLLVQAMCPDDMITQPGRINRSWVPEFVAVDAFQRAATYSPITPLQDTGTYTGPALALALAFEAPPTDDRQRALLPGLIVDIGTSLDTPPGKVTANLAATFENGAAYTQQVQMSLGHIGLSRFVILFSREVQGGAYPQLAVVDNGSLVGYSEGVEADPVYGAVKGIDFTVTNGPPGITVNIEGLSPISELWYAVLANWYATRQVGS